jgi:hypothetical protein
MDLARLADDQVLQGNPLLFSDCALQESVAQELHIINCLMVHQVSRSKYVDAAPKFTVFESKLAMATRRHSCGCRRSGREHTLKAHTGMLTDATSISPFLAV